MKTIQIYFLLIVTSFLFSCSHYKIKSEGDVDKVKDFEKIALLNVYIDPPAAPFLAILTNSAYLERFNKIKRRVAEYNYEKIDTLRDYMALKLKEYSGKEVIYGKELENKVLNADLKVEGVNLQNCTLDDVDFKRAVMCDGAVNVFDFSKFPRAVDYFESDSVWNQASDLLNLCRILEVDGIVVVTISVPVTKSKVWFSGVKAYRILKEDFFFFDSNGTKICTGNISTPAEEGGADDIEHYGKTLEKYYIWTDLYLGHLYKNQNPHRYVEQKEWEEYQKRLE